MAKDKFYLVKALAMETKTVYYLRNFRNYPSPDIDLIMGADKQGSLLLLNEAERAWLKVNNQRKYRKIAKQIGIPFRKHA